MAVDSDGSLGKAHHAGPIISALIRKPKLLILDEPFVGLDPAAAHLLKGYLRELCEAGGAVFFSDSRPRPAVRQGESCRTRK